MFFVAIPTCFSNTLAPAIVVASIKVFDIISSSNKLITKLNDNKSFFRKKMTNLGFDLKEGDHPIVPVMLYEQLNLSPTVHNFILRVYVFPLNQTYTIIYVYIYMYIYIYR